MKTNWFKINKKILIIDNMVDYFIKGFSNHDFCCIVIYLKQGENCKDCEKYYFNCNCNFWLGDPGQETIRRPVFILYWIKHNLSKKNVKYLIYYLKKFYPDYLSIVKNLENLL